MTKTSLQTYRRGVRGSLSQGKFRILLRKGETQGAGNGGEAGETSASSKLEQQLERPKAENMKLVNAAHEAAVLAALPQVHRNR